MAPPRDEGAAEHFAALAEGGADESDTISASIKWYPSSRTPVIPSDSVSFAGAARATITTRLRQTVCARWPVLFRP